MFTGLIQALGRLRIVAPNRLQVDCQSNLILQDLTIGDSVAVDGVCLTVEEVLSPGFIVAVSPETLQRTTLEHQVMAEALVNLETSLRVGSKLGGHFVTGHVDGVGCLQALVQTADSWEMSITAPAAMEGRPSTIARYVVPKGSITINGVSLTVADCNPEGTQFKVAVIPHSFAATNLRYLQPGSSVNLEADLLGKYVEKFLHSNHNGYLSSSVAVEAPGDLSSPPGRDFSSQSITPEFLAEHGFM
jgi:riboflavin synthase